MSLVDALPKLTQTSPKFTQIMGEMANNLWEPVNICGKCQQFVGIGNRRSPLCPQQRRLENTIVAFVARKWPTCGGFFKFSPN
ncbi:hypothetical protein PMG71_05740 [Roseofilum sp. BLCC_M154]|uniref:Uncharacterized protein n=1 Tax=Roseofilum acuticapitatum BLCC-M154 TaxID=3022444 RepID=A0ABT7AQU1_9CYAN|nr:hypothetical protein [Roseofilum acuticapitatum]MDJ1168922.1 hypothetical protein [Roseofilum acuticapitatum BLCC-M154]